MAFSAATALVVMPAASETIRVEIRSEDLHLRTPRALAGGRNGMVPPLYSSLQLSPNREVVAWARYGR